MKCEKCDDAEARFRHQYGYIAVEGGSRWVRYFMLCPECFENAKLSTEGKQQPLWYFVTKPMLDDDGNQVVVNGEKKWINGLVNSGKTIWPEDAKGKNYGSELSHPAAARNAIDHF